MLRALPLEEQDAVLLQLSRHVQRDIITQLPEPELLPILEQIDPDRTTDLLQLLPPRKQKRITGKLKEEIGTSVAFLAQFDPQTAAGIMRLNYILVEETARVATIVKRLREHEERTGHLPVVLAMRGNELTGHIHGYMLSLARPTESLKKYVRPIPTVAHSTHYREVIKRFKQHRHDIVAVLGETGNVLGIVYSDDLLRLIEDRELQSLYTFAGVHDEESVTDPASRKIRHRYKWLIINLGTAFLAAATVSLFEDVITKYVLLAVYMPIVAGMGGNAGTQALAVVVRGIALNQIELRTAWRALKQEIIAGLANGIINGIIVAGIVVVTTGERGIALVLGLAMVISLLTASFFGTLVPLIMKRLGKDPATSATIFITTATDVLGFLAFLGLATLLLM